MKLFARKKLKANFRRKGTQVFIEVHVPGEAFNQTIHSGVVQLGANRFGERDLREIVTQLEAQEDSLIKQGNLPYVYNAMLTELKGVVEGDYGGRPRK